MLPGIKKFFEDLEANTETLLDARRQVEHDLPYPEQPANFWSMDDSARRGWYVKTDAVDAERRPHHQRLDAEFSQRKDKIEATLIAKAKDPLVTWLVKVPMRSYASHTKTILEALPAPVSELDRIAAGRGWCSEWDRFKERAFEKGILKDDTPPAVRAAKRVLEQSGIRSSASRAMAEDILRALSTELTREVNENYADTSHIGTGVRKAAQFLNPDLPAPKPPRVRNKVEISPAVTTEVNNVMVDVTATNAESAPRLEEWRVTLAENQLPTYVFNNLTVS